ncbi:flavodoxin [Ruminiclostridium cellobioparum]|uniref:Flavodoxin n=1 Tax=Ruminiclostridium cellobioparum subsp. termitidis CT1112 TaxID=1195236 RepID=S0FQ18_RUMCE|nr:flavodoxin [Ruminiclostridium cellobioparum]EMS72436.1 flavodoxin, short chain [Ruminiclostridium cellobioparum subsp. termitidis CT1112]
MKNIAVIYWSGTGNTQQMALAVAEGARSSEVEVAVKDVGSATLQDIQNSDAVALGCPSMGSEVLEESEMEPFVQSLEDLDLKGKPMVLFGSYDWGDGQWMFDWEERMTGLGVKLAGDGLKVHITPDEEGLKLCRELGQKLASSI